MIQFWGLGPGPRAQAQGAGRLEAPWAPLPPLGPLRDANVSGGRYVKKAKSQQSDPEHDDVFQGLLKQSTEARRA